MTSILARIDEPSHLKTLTQEELVALTHELREVIINVVAKNGGHLASSLGVVELTVALHYVFSSPQDKIIWDVGHQSYAHKLLTGRKERFQTLRKFQGLSGFPTPEESPHDIFATGHASTSISAALGLALACKLKNEDYHVVAVIGDGGMGGGMAFEALNHAGSLKRDLLVVLNSNEFAISKTVGALASYINRLITMPIYNRLKLDLLEFINKVPKIGASMVALSRRIEEGIKNLIVHGAFFEELGFRYFGPIDGHNLPLLIDTLSKIKRLKGPRLLHVFTKKGKGYKPAEENPGWFHGTAPFNKETGKPLLTQGAPSYSEVFGEELINLALRDPSIVVLTAAMEKGVGLEPFHERFKDRFFDVGIAEAHAVTMAAGMAKGGLKPIVAVYSTFLQRAYDQILHDVCLQRLPVVFAVDRASIVGEDGPTHHGIFDIAYLSHIPNLTIMCPADRQEFREMLALAFKLNGPVVIRYWKGEVRDLPLPKESVKFYKACILKEGKDGYIIALGRMIYPSLGVVERLKKDGFDVGLINPRFIKPLDEKLFLEVSKTPLITIEEHVLTGGFGSLLSSCLLSLGVKDLRIKCIGLPDRFIEHGSIEELHTKYGLTEETLYPVIKKFLISSERSGILRFIQRMVR